jgi:hypothetical protein
VQQIQHRHRTEIPRSRSSPPPKPPDWVRARPASSSRRAGRNFATATHWPRRVEELTSRDYALIDGLTEDLITDLSKVSGLLVIALLRVQGAGRSKCRRSGEPRRALCARGQRPQGRQSRAHHGVAHRYRQRRASLGRAVRSRSHGHLLDAGRGGGEDSRHTGGHADEGIVISGT